MQKESNLEVSECVVSVVVYLLLCAICNKPSELISFLFSS